ncbi:copper amine oxidase N-terminal domain-containing protein [Marinisporobacter balticus]|uniref:Copper amine oxidase-like protein n=1 Tax=Marinisporobacter balticus TaxID=2018667 RepID=A0A4R2L7V8_9FIRM|nr:copper amine oxidase N-terminal domain-containing protein [Marinisporobacter balticus]TCO78768.1 copper amine oxidase-like protein [Marinisporobacter balticus]
MKRKISLLLVLALMLTLVPMSAFAASDNSVSKIMTVKADTEIDTDAPYLRIENNKGDFGTKETIELRLENAEWLDEVDETFAVEFDKAATSTVAATVYRKSDTRVELVVENAIKDDVINMPLHVKVLNDGEAKVIVSSKSGVVTEGTYKFATAVNASTTIRIDDTITFSNVKAIEPIEIEENAVGAIDVAKLKYIRVELDKDFKLQYDNIAVTGDLINGTLDATAVEKIDDNIIKINFAAGTLKSDLGIRGDIEINGLTVNPGKNAKEGKVYVTIKSNVSEISTTKLEMGKFAEYDVEVKADGEAKEIYGGRYEGVNTTDDAHELQKLIIEEKVEGSWLDGRTVSVEFPSWVKILNVTKSGDTITNEDTDKNEFEFDITKTTGKKKVELTFFISVEAGKTGDVTAKVESRGLDEDYEVVLGKALAPATITAEVAKIKAGVRDQEIGKITIAETDEDAIKKGDLILELDKDLDWDGEPTVKVTKGDLEIDEDNIDVKDNVLTIKVERESSEPSTIEITNAKVKVDRSIAEGAVKVEVKGDALIQNGYDKTLADSKTVQLDNGRFDKDYYAKLEVASVITPADNNTSVAKAVQFVIGNAEYTVDGEVKTADVAPYITDGRTMLSLRYVAEAMGVEDHNIIWDGATRTVTILKGDRIAQVEIGSNKLFVNGAVIPMDTVAVIKDGRTMLPVSFIAKALGSQVEWDGATRTVTIK